MFGAASVATFPSGSCLFSALSGLTASLASRKDKIQGEVQGTRNSPYLLGRDFSGREFQTLGG